MVVSGLAAAFRSHLALYVVANQELMTDVQPRIIRTLRVPEYFANFRETGDALACYLGCSIVAKVRHDASAHIGILIKV
jgi:actin-related protein 9